MPLTLEDCAEALQQAGLRHHVDGEQQLIRLVLVTNRYRNRRGEHLAIVTIGVQDDGHRLRLSLERAFEAGRDPAVACLLACRCAAATPLVAAEYDADFDNLRLVTESVVGEQGADSAMLGSLVEHLVSAAEVWQVAFDAQRQADDAVGMHGQAA